MEQITSTIDIHVTMSESHKLIRRPSQHTPLKYGTKLGRLAYPKPVPVSIHGSAMNFSVLASAVRCASRSTGRFSRLDAMVRWP
jgi:hypothetical protein